jgi:hypothetical protein
MPGTHPIGDGVSGMHDSKLHLESRTTCAISPSFAVSRSSVSGQLGCGLTRSTTEALCMLFLTSISLSDFKMSEKKKMLREHNTSLCVSRSLSLSLSLGCQYAERKQNVAYDPPDLVFYSMVKTTTQDVSILTYIVVIILYLFLLT